MKATGEVMAIGRTMEESLMKAVRSLEIGVDHIYLEKFDSYTTEELLESIKTPTDERLYAIGELFTTSSKLNVWASQTAIWQKCSTQTNLKCSNGEKKEIFSQSIR